MFNFDNIKEQAVYDAHQLASLADMELTIENIDFLGKILIGIIENTESIAFRNKRLTNTIYALGIYLGEEILKESAGEWVPSFQDIEYCVQLNCGNRIYPLERVEDFIQSPEEFSLFEFYKENTLKQK